MYNDERQRVGTSKTYTAYELSAFIHLKQITVGSQSG